MRCELTDYEWSAIKPFLPNKPRGVPRVNDRRVLNGIFWVLRSGAPWRDLPETFAMTKAQIRQPLTDRMAKGAERADALAEVFWTSPRRSGKTRALSEWVGRSSVRPRVSGDPGPPARPLIQPLDSRHKASEATPSSTAMRGNERR